MFSALEEAPNRASGLLAPSGLLVASGWAPWHSPLRRSQHPSGVGAQAMPLATGAFGGGPAVFVGSLGPPL